MNASFVIELAGAVVDAQTVIDEPVHILISNGVVVAWNKGKFQASNRQESAMDIIRKPRHIAIPGLINTHGHAAMTLLRGAGDDLPLMVWLNDRIFPLEEKLTADAIYWGTQLATWEMMISGTTAYTDMYMMMDNTAKAVAESGMRGVLSVGAVGFDEENRKNGIERSRSFVQNWNGEASGRITTTLGPHAPYTCPPDYLQELSRLSQELSVPIQIHLSETGVEVENCIRDHGMTPIALAAKSDLFARPVLAAHCVHVNDDDIEILRDYGVRVAHNPQSNLKLGSGVAPLVKMLDAGLLVGLGTDGAASNNNLDMFEEMRLAATLHKGVLEDAQAVPASTAFRLATEDGAKACFLPPDAGTLRPGSAADIVLLSTDSPHVLPGHNLMSNIVYAFGADDVQDVFVAGRQIVSNRIPITIDTERVRYETKRLINLFSI